MNDPTEMTDERKAQIDAVLNGAPPTWEVELYEEQVGITLAEINDFGTPEDSSEQVDLLKLQLKLSQHRHELTRVRIGSLVKSGRSEQTRRVGKQYGEASRTIHALRAEIALLREQLRDAPNVSFYVATPMEYGVAYNYPDTPDRPNQISGPLPLESVERIVESTQARGMGMQASKIERHVDRGHWYRSGSDEPVEESK